MGYAVRIRRKERPIPLDEWVAFAKAAPDLRGGSSILSSRSGRSRPPVFTWNDAVFEWKDGEIVVDDLSDEWCKKLGEIAAGLGAEAVGDDGERYLADGRVDYGEGAQTLHRIRTLAAFRYEPPARRSSSKTIVLVAVAVALIVAGVAVLLLRR